MRWFEHATNTVKDACGLAGRNLRSLSYRQTAKHSLHYITISHETELCQAVCYSLRSKCWLAWANGTIVHSLCSQWLDHNAVPLLYRLLYKPLFTSYLTDGKWQSWPKNTMGKKLLVYVVDWHDMDLSINGNLASVTRLGNTTVVTHI